MFNRKMILTALLLAIVLIAPQSVKAQSPVPMLFTGTASLDGKLVASGTVITVYTARGFKVGSATTGASGQAANAWTTTIFDTSLEDQTLYFYITLSSGTILPASDQKQVTAVYDAEGGRGRATVTIDVQTPTAKPTPTPTPIPTAARLTLPEAPSSFQAISDGAKGMLLTWRDAATNEDGYELWRWDVMIGWKLVGVPAPNAVSYADSGLSVGVTYYYYIGAYNSLGYSDFVLASATTPAPTLQMPSGVRVDVSGTAARLSWRDDTTSEDGYELWRWNERAGWTYLGGLAANSSSYADSGLTPGAIYWYYLASYSGTTYSAWAEISAEIPAQAPAATTTTRTAN